MAIHEIRVDRKDEDPKSAKLARDVLAEFGEVLTSETSDVYYVEGISKIEAEQLAQVLTNPVTQTPRLEPRADWSKATTIEVTDREGIINPAIETIATTARRHGIPIGNMAVGTEISFAEATPPELVARVAEAILVNKEIQRIRTAAPDSLSSEGLVSPTEMVDIGTMSDDDLERFSREHKLGLSLAKMQAARTESQKTGGRLPEGSLRLLGPYWSDHCRHETFNANQLVDGKLQKSLFSSIKEAAKKHYDAQEVIQAFDGNSAVFKLHTDKNGKAWAINIKGETHNHPTLIEAYGGVATGVGGLLRDIIMTGKGAKPIAQVVSMGMGFMDMTSKMIPKGLQTPKQIMQRGVRAISEYGNRVGVPTVDAAFHHHAGYRGKPVFLGVAIGLMPEVSATEDVPQPGDILFVIGGRTGQDGVGGATGSSIASNTETLASTSEVQVPNAIEEKKMMDAILEARDLGFIRAMTDCGAGGVGLAAGELGEAAGLEIDISRLPLKAEDFEPWMKLISESQERGVVAVPPEYADQFQALFAKHDSSAIALGVMGAGGDNPRFIVRHGDEIVSDWSYDFLKNGIPTLTLESNYVAPEVAERSVQISDYGEALQRILAHDDIRSVEQIIRQFDHEVQAGNVLKPFTGVNMDCPNNASVIAPFIDEDIGVVFAHSAHPNLTDIDPDKGTAWVVDDLMARIVSVGGDPTKVKINNNYISPRPTGQVMGAMRISVNRLLEKLDGFNTAPFTGKDSCSSEHTDESGNLIRGPYNLSLAGISPIPDIRQTTSADIKRTDSTLVLIGKPDLGSMGGSTLYEEFDGSSAKVPQADFGMDDLEYYQRVHQVVQPATVLSSGVVGKGGLAVTVSKMLFGGDCGADLYLNDSAPLENVLFNESAGCFVIEVPGGTDVDELLDGLPHQVLGRTKAARDLTVNYSTGTFFSESLDELKRVWKAPNQEIFV